MWWAIAGIVLIGAALWGPMASNVEQAKYTVVQAYEAIEIRDYAPAIVAETETTGERDKAINDGFRLIADYIFGNNTSKQKVAMTAPVIQQSNEKIAMTAPVIQQPSGNAWKVQFVMPSTYTMETLPKPNNDKVTLRAIPAKRFSVIRFSGTSGKENLVEHTKLLQDFIKAKNLTALTPPTYAFYNPPWTLPPLRRNEVMVEIESTP